MFDTKQYRSKEKEKQRVRTILQMATEAGCADTPVETVLEAGCRDGHITRLLADRFPHITALDLQLPEVDLPNVTCVQGDLTATGFASGAFDLVICTEVLEHIPEENLQKACDELWRLSNKYLLIGVPYRQDLRVHATKCLQCGAINPTTGHLHSFDLERLLTLFDNKAPVRIVFAGEGVYKTNRCSYALYKRFGFLYGSYEQEEPCIRCGARLEKPQLPWFSRFMCLVAKGLEFLQNKTGPRDRSPVWIHLLWDTTTAET